MITRRGVLAAFGASALGVSACSRTEALTRTGLEEERLAADSPALAAAAVSKNHGVMTWASGERSLGGGVPVTDQDLWHLGSITKSMTATLVARLVESGALRWDDTVGELLKDIAPDMNEAYRSANFRHLLSHRAGLPKDIPLQRLLSYSPDATHVRDERRSYAREALRLGPVSARETDFSYSNNGYVIAGAMLEVKLDTAWEELMRTHVFEPLKLATAGFGPPGENGKLTQPVGHYFDGERLVPIAVGHRYADNPCVLGPGGRVHMSLEDVLTYLSAHRDTIPFLKPDTWQTLHTPPFGGDYAMGWEIRREGVLSHTGSNRLWFAKVSFSTRRGGPAAVVVANSGRPRTGIVVEATMERALAAVS